MKLKKTVVALRGKAINTRYGKGIPFVGADEGGTSAQLGIGILFPKNKIKGFVWGMISPRNLIQSWRAMKILEQVDSYSNDTILCPCWYAAKTDIHSSDKHYLDKLAGQFKSVWKFKRVRKEALNSAPAAKELQSMLRTLRKRKVEVSAWELEKEIRKGNIKTSPLIEKTKKEQKERIKSLEELERKQKRRRSIRNKLKKSAVEKLTIFGKIKAFFKNL